MHQECKKLSRAISSLQITFYILQINQELKVVYPQCDQIMQNFKSVWPFLKVYFVFGQILKLLWQMFYAIGQISLL